MCVVKVLLVAFLVLALVVVGCCSGGLRGRNRRHRHRHNPYTAPPVTDYVADDYEEVEISPYCRESVAHHENYVRAMTQAPNSSSKVIILFLARDAFVSTNRRSIVSICTMFVCPFVCLSVWDRRVL